MRLIDADKLRENLIGYIPVSDSVYSNMVDRGVEMALYELGKMPTIEAEPVRHGRPERRVNIFRMNHYMCSECDRVVFSSYDKLPDINYCKYCGAKMDLEDKTNEISTNKH